MKTEWSEPMHGLKNLTFIVMVLTLASSGAQNENRMFINPALKSYDIFPEIKTVKSFFVDTVRDTDRGRSDSGVIGYAHTRSKHPTAIVCRPKPAAAVGSSLETLLVKKGIAQSDRSAATYLIRVSLLAFGLKETPHFLYQTMDATVQFKIELIDPHTAQIAQQFTIGSERSRTTFNAARKSEAIIRDALRNALVEVLQTLKSL